MFGILVGTLEALFILITSDALCLNIDKKNKTPSTHRIQLRERIIIT